MPGKRFARVALCLSFFLAAPALAQSDPLNAAEICAANPQVDAYGMLAWGEDHVEGKSMPYDLTCPNLRFSTAGKRVTVKAADIKQALAAFSAQSLFLSYFDELHIRYDGEGHLSADPVRDVPNEFIDDIFRITVTVTPHRGQPHLLLKNAMSYPLTLPADQAFTIDLAITDSATGLSIPWPRIEIDPARGQISATLGKQQ